MKLGENIYRLRMGRNLSQGDLADLLDVSRQSVSKWENGVAVPDLDKLLKLSILFGVTLDDLVNGASEEEIALEPEPQEPAVLQAEMPPEEVAAPEPVPDITVTPEETTEVEFTLEAESIPEPAAAQEEPAVLPRPVYRPASSARPGQPGKSARRWTGVAAALLLTAFCTAAALDLAHLSNWAAAVKGRENEEVTVWQSGTVELIPEMRFSNTPVYLSPIEDEQTIQVAEAEQGTLGEWVCGFYKTDGVCFAVVEGEGVIPVEPQK